jgi:hypothetical protein
MQTSIIYISNTFWKLPHIDIFPLFAPASSPIASSVIKKSLLEAEGAFWHGSTSI